MNKRIITVWIYRVMVIALLFAIHYDDSKGQEHCKDVRKVMVEVIGDGIDRQNELRDSFRRSSKLMVDVTAYIYELEGEINKLKKDTKKSYVDNMEMKLNY